MSLLSHEARSQRWYRGIFAGSLAVLCTLAIGAGCQTTDTAESEGEDVAAEAQGQGGKLSSRPAMESQTPMFAGAPQVGAVNNVPAGVVPTCVTITDGVNGGVTQDALLSGDYPASPSGPFFGTWTGVSSGGNMNYSLFKFGLGALPSGNNVVVTSATMNVYVSWNPQNSVVGVHKALQPWAEESVTSSSYPSSSWDPATVASFSAGGVGARSIDVTSLAQGWLNGSVANNGVVFEEAPVASHYFFTKEAGDASYRPSLNVCYYVNNGPAPWVKVFGGAGTQKVTSVATAADGSVFAVGQFQGTIDLGGSTFTSGNSEDMWVAKFDKNGNHLWSKQFGTAGMWHVARGSAVGPDGSVFLAGEFSGSIDFGDGMRYSNIVTTFVIKFDANGNLVWVRGGGTEGTNSGWTVGVAPNGDVLFGGLVNVPAPQNPMQLSLGGVAVALGYQAPTTAFLVRYNSAGTLLSQIFANTSGAQLVKDVAVDSQGRPVIAAHMEEGAAFCSSSSGGGVSMSDFNEARFTTGLGCNWGYSVGDPFSNDEATAVAIGPGDNAVVGGMTGAVAPQGNVINAAYAGIHLRKHDGAGALLWDKKFATGSVAGVGVDSVGLIWATGRNFDAVNVTGGVALPANGSWLIRLDANGNGLTQSTFGSAVNPADLAMAPDNSGVVVGNFTGTGTFNGTNYTANGTDAFIVKMAP
ncbi:MAG: DNRLRE domain-containing protein [Polyangiaceae bacterium]